MNSMKRQQGQTLGGMILGILIAVVILGGAFWFFSQQKAPFQPDVIQKEEPAPAPEIIVPSDGLESILHKDPSEWLSEGNEAQPEVAQPPTQAPKPAVDTPKQPAVKPVPAPDELGAFIEKDLAKKENLVVAPKPTTVPAVKLEPAKPVVEKPVEKQPVKVAQPPVEKKPEPVKTPPPEKKPAEPVKPVKPAEPTKPAEPAKVAAKSGTLQAGAYRTPAQAEEQKVKLALMGYTANVIKSDLGEKGIMYRVRMGVSDTQSAKNDLANKGVDVMVVR